MLGSAILGEVIGTLLAEAILVLAGARHRPARIRAASTVEDVSASFLDSWGRLLAGMGHGARGPLAASVAASSPLLDSPGMAGYYRKLVAVLVHPDDAARFEHLRNVFLAEARRAGVAAEDAAQAFEAVALTLDAALGAQVGASEPLTFRELFVWAGSLRGELHGLDALRAGRHAANVDPLELEAFERRYRAAARAAHEHILPAAFATRRVLPLATHYVPPRFVRGPDDDAVTLGLDTVDKVAHRLVVLGDPGAGKTSFMEALAHRHASDPARRVPFLLPVRALPPLAAGRSISEGVASHVRGRYSVACDARHVEALLESGQGMLLLDGLDELLETAERRSVVRTVASIAALYPLAPIFVTSRIVGYDEAPLPENVFPTVRLAPFSGAQVEQYVRAWFALDHEKGAADAFLAESESVADLRGNSLLLSLLCAIYRGQGSLPRHREGVYRRCAELLFEESEEKKGLPKGPLRTRARSVLRELAYAAQAKGGAPTAFPRRALVRAIGEQLRDMEPAEAAALAERFIDHATRRIWVFSETGTDAHGQPLFAFTHRAFLEFFCAERIVHQTADARELAASLLPRIERQEWDMVCHLALHARDVEHADANEALDALLQRAASGGRGGWRALVFGARSLAYLIADERNVQQLARLTVRALEDWTRASQPEGAHRASDGYFDHAAAKDFHGNHVLAPLVYGRDENHALVDRHLAAELTRVAATAPPDVFRTLVDVIEHVGSTRAVQQGSLGSRRLRDPARFAWARDCVRALSPRWREHAQEDPGLASVGLRMGGVPVEAAVRRYGFAILQHMPDSRLFRTSPAFSHATTLLGAALEPEKATAEHLEQLAALGRILSDPAPLPGSDPTLPGPFAPPLFDADPARRPGALVELDGAWRDRAGGVFLLLAAAADMREPYERPVASPSTPPELRTPLLALRARKKEDVWDELRRALDEVAYPPVARARIEAWARGEGLLAIPPLRGLPPA